MNMTCDCFPQRVGTIGEDILTEIVDKYKDLRCLSKSKKEREWILRL